MNNKIKAGAVKCAMVMGLTLASATGAHAAVIIGNETQVTVTAFDAITDLGLTISPFGSAGIDVVDMFPIATFQITGGMIDDGSGAAVIMHDGSGLTLSAGDMSVTFSDFVIDTEELLLTSMVSMGSGDGAEIALFTIDDDLNLFLTDAAAGGLTTVFGAPNLAGLQFGTASLDIATVTAVPEPAAWAMMIFGFGLAGSALRYRRRPELKLSTAAS